MRQMASYPVIDLAAFLNNQSGDSASCTQIATLLREFGMLIVKDPRVDDSLNTNFLNMMEQYYDQAAEVRAQDSRPDVHYQVGVTPEQVEHDCARIKGLNESEKPLALRLFFQSRLDCRQTFGPGKGKWPWACFFERALGFDLLTISKKLLKQCCIIRLRVMHAAESKKETCEGQGPADARKEQAVRCGWVGLTAARRVRLYRIRRV